MKKIILLGFIFLVSILLFKSCHRPEMLNPEGFDDILRRHEIINTKRTEVALRRSGVIAFRIRLNTNSYEFEEILYIRESIAEYLQSDLFAEFVESHEWLCFEQLNVFIGINDRRNQRVLSTSSYCNNFDIWVVNYSTNVIIYDAARSIPNGFTSVIESHAIIDASRSTWHNDNFNQIRIEVHTHEMDCYHNFNLDEQLEELKQNVSLFLQSNAFYNYVLENMHLKWGSLNIQLIIREPMVLSASHRFSTSQATDFYIWQTIE